MTATSHTAKGEPIWRSVSIFSIIFLITWAIINIQLSPFLFFIPLAISSSIAFTVTYLQRKTDLVTIFEGGPIYEQSLIDYFIGWSVLSLVSILAIGGMVSPGEGIDPLIAVGIYVAVLALFVLDTYAGLLSPVLGRIPETRSLGLYYSVLFFPLFALHPLVHSVFEGTASQIGSAILLLLIVTLILVDAIRAR